MEEQDISYEERATGKEAKELFYDKSSKINKLMQKTTNSPFIQFIEYCNSNNIVPQPIGMTGSKDKNNFEGHSEVQTAGFKMGDNYA